MEELEDSLKLNQREWEYFTKAQLEDRDKAIQLLDMGKRNKGRKICHVANNNKIIAASKVEAKWMSIELMGDRNIETIPLSLTCLLKGNKPDDREIFMEVVGKTKDRKSNIEEASKSQHDPASEHAKDKIQLFRLQMMKSVSDETMEKVNWETL